MILSRKPGSDHVRLPNSISIAGARNSTRNAASATATVSPTPNCLMTGSSIRIKLPKTLIMISAAAKTTRALAARPWRSASSWLMPLACRPCTVLMKNTS